MYDTLGRLTDATGVQLPGVLDDLYAGRAAQATLGPVYSGGGWWSWKAAR